MGSRKGIPNQPKRLLVTKLKAAYGDNFNVIMEMAENGRRVQAVADIAWDTLTISMNDLQTDVNSHTPEDLLTQMGRVRATAVDAVNTWDRVAQYVQPKLKAVEITAEVNGTQDHNWKVEFVNPSDNPLLSGKVEAPESK